MRCISRNAVFVFFIFLTSVIEVWSKDLVEHALTDRYPYPNKVLLSFTSCSDGPVEFVPSTGGFLDFVVISNKLDNSCFADLRQKFAEQLYQEDSERAGDLGLAPTDYDFGLDFIEMRAEQNQERYEVASVISPFQLTCVEDCRYLEDQIVRVSSDYYFLHTQSDYGVEVTMINSNVLLFKTGNATYTGNLIFDIQRGVLTALPSGELEWVADGIIVRGAKRYFKEGGAYWYDKKIDFSGGVVEFYDVEGGTCLAIDEFDVEFQKQLKLLSKEKLCVDR